MGTEIVFVLILPIAVLCLLAAVFFWSRVATVEWGARSGPLRAYVPLFAGFAVSMAGLALLTYIECYADFTSLIQQGYYTEAERGLYLLRRVVGQAIVTLVFLLPAISFGVVPLTTWLIRRGRLTFKDIGLFVIIGWFALSLVGWVFNFAIITPPYSFPSFLGSTAIPVLLYGLPIPVAALWLFRPRARPGNH
ncbi:MAG: hypothetical protein EOP17_06245 [Rhizobiaceae bacterium]|nr:MAG: hypothetical protein EOP17_06245 [Rhizobiaceae bacterium]